MKKLFLVIFLLVLFKPDSGCVVSYLSDELDGGSGYTTSSVPTTTKSSSSTSSVYNFLASSDIISADKLSEAEENYQSINQQKAALRDQINDLRDLLADETNPVLIAYYESEISRLESQLDELQTMSDVERTALQNYMYQKCKETYNILNGIIKTINDILRSIIRNIG